MSLESLFCAGGILKEKQPESPRRATDYFREGARNRNCMKYDIPASLF